MKKWTPRDWRSFLALLGCIGGGIVSTVLSAYLVELTADPRWHQGLPVTARLQIVMQQLDILKPSLLGSLALMGLSIVGLWFVLGRRHVNVELGKFKASAGNIEEEETDVRTSSS